MAVDRSLIIRLPQHGRKCGTRPERSEGRWKLFSMAETAIETAVEISTWNYEKQNACLQRGWITLSKLLTYFETLL